MGAAMKEIIELYHAVGGGYSYLGLLLIGLLFLYLKKPDQRELLIYPNLIFMAIFFNPLFKNIIETYFLGKGVFWRLWWLIPINGIIALMCIFTLDLIKKKYEKVIVFMAACLIIVMSGKPVFNDGNFVRTENKFKMPNEILEIGNAIELDQNEKTAEENIIVAPYDVAWTIRMYNPGLYMLYGRNPELSEGLYTEKLYGLVNGETIDLEALHSLLKINNVKYVVLKNKQVDLLQEEHMDPKHFEYEEIGHTDNYSVYRTNF